MIREALDSEADVPVIGNELMGSNKNAKKFNEKERTLRGGVGGIRALSVDDVDRELTRINESPQVRRIIIFELNRRLYFL